MGVLATCQREAIATASASASDWTATLFLASQAAARMSRLVRTCRRTSEPSSAFGACTDVPSRRERRFLQISTRRQSRQDSAAVGLEPCCIEYFSSMTHVNNFNNEKTRLSLIRILLTWLLSLLHTQPQVVAMLTTRPAWSDHEDS